MTDNASIYCLSVPLFKRSRVMLSSQMLCPEIVQQLCCFHSFDSQIGFAYSLMPPLGWALRIVGSIPPH